MRLMNNGVLSASDVSFLGITGIIARASGVYYDLRVNMPYEQYKNINFIIPIGLLGDSYDRYLIRMEEMQQSIFIILQLLFILKKGPIYTNSSKEFFTFFSDHTYDMATFIYKYKIGGSFMNINKNNVYVSVESPKGETGVFLLTNNTAYVTRCKIRVPGLMHLNALEYLSYNINIADLVTLIGSLDFVFGEIDK